MDLMKRYLLIAIFIIGAILCIKVVVTWRKDCKMFGRENLAVPLKHRLRILFIYIVLLIIAVLSREDG